MIFGNWKGNSNFCVSLPNASEKDVKGLLFRKQPLHTSPNGGANVCELSHTFLRAMRASPHLHPKGEAGVSRLSSLRNLTSPPRLCSRVESQTECSKPERFDELALAKLLAIHYVYLQKQEKRKRKLPKARLKEQPCFVKYNRINLNFKDKVNFLCR